MKTINVQYEQFLWLNFLLMLVIFSLAIISYKFKSRLNKIKPIQNSRFMLKEQFIYDPKFRYDSIISVIEDAATGKEYLVNIHGSICELGK